MADYFDGYDEAFGSFLPQFDYLLIDLSKFSNDEIKEVVFKKAALKITLLMMKNIFHEEELERNLADYLEIGRLYFEEEKGLKFLESIVRYLYKSTNIEVNKVISATKTISERGGEVTMTTAMRLIEQGKKEGELKGELKGQRNGLKIAIELGLELKFGVEGLKLFERISSIESIERLHVIKEAIKISKNLEEISNLLGD